MPIQFQFVPSSGDLSGVSFEEQIKTAFNELGDAIDDGNALAQQASDAANAARATSENALNTAQGAITQAQGAQAAAGNAQATANQAVLDAAAAQATANQSLTMAGEAVTTADKALIVADGIENIATAARHEAAEALEAATNAQTTADSALNIANQAAGQYQATDDIIDANFFLEPSRMFVVNSNSANFPPGVTFPVYFDVISNTENQGAKQIVMPTNTNDVYIRNGVANTTIVPSTDTISFSAAPSSGTVIDGYLAVTASPDPEPLAATFTPGSFAAREALPGEIFGTITFYLANFIDGIISINGFDAITATGGGFTFNSDYTIVTEAGSLQVTSVNGTATEVSIEIAYTWSIYSFADWVAWEVLGGGTPSGVITMWSGAADAVPAGWALCDGQNGTPDLRDRFIVGAGGAHAVGATGGSTSVGLTGSVGNTTLTLSQIPSHTHNTIAGNSSGSGGVTVGGTSSPRATSANGGNGAHGHSLALNNISIEPPYYALAYIMKL